VYLGEYDLMEVWLVVLQTVALDSEHPQDHLFSFLT
jgi:hypothetical protein